MRVGGVQKQIPEGMGRGERMGLNIQGEKGAGQDPGGSGQAGSSQELCLLVPMNIQGIHGPNAALATLTYYQLIYPHKTLKTGFC